MNPRFECIKWNSECLTIPTLRQTRGTGESGGLETSTPVLTRCLTDTGGLSNRWPRMRGACVCPVLEAARALLCTDRSLDEVAA